MRRLTFALICLLSTPLVLSAASPAYAQQPTTEEARRSAARVLFNDGLALQEKGEYARALEKFEGANKYFPAPTITLHIAQCQANLGKLVEAAETYRVLERTPKQDNWPPQFLQAKEQGRAELAQVDARTPKLLIDVDPHPPGIRLQFDGAEFDPVFLGVSRPVNPGKHRIVAFAPGFATADQSVDLSEKESKKQVVKLAAASGGGAVVPPGPGPGPGTGTGTGTTSDPNTGTAVNIPYNNVPQPIVTNQEATTALYGSVDLGYAFVGGKVPNQRTPTTFETRDLKEISSNGFAMALGLGIRLRNILIGGLYQGAIISKGSTNNAAYTHFLGAQLGYLTRTDGVGLWLELAAGARIFSFDSAVVNDPASLTGFEVLGGIGLSLRLARGIRLIPKATLSFGTTTATGTSGSGFGSSEISETAGHTLFGLAVGGQFDIVALSKPPAPPPPPAAAPR
ncbi:MAG: hypothetical protein HOO96_33170 [Polyangiaceae bacterium]|nr:hypothetical protein [Polyangiaceae bacterium]